MKKRKKRAIALTVALFLMIGLLLAGVIYQIEVIRTCNKIQSGTFKSTFVSNGITFPSFLAGVANVFSAGGGPHIPLVEACRCRDVTAVRTLLKNGANPNFSYKGYFYPLEAVCPITDEASYEIAKLLIEYGADANLHASSWNVLECELLHYQIIVEKNGEDFFSESICFLIDHGADVKQKAFGDSCFLIHLAVYRTSGKVLQLMINEYGAEVDALDSNGKTPLILAAERGKEEMVTILLQNHASKTITDTAGKTAYDYAVENGYTELAELLKP